MITKYTPQYFERDITLFIRRFETILSFGDENHDDFIPIGAKTGDVDKT